MYSNSFDLCLLLSLWTIIYFKNMVSVQSKAYQKYGIIVFEKCVDYMENSLNEADNANPGAPTNGIKYRAPGVYKMTTGITSDSNPAIADKAAWQTYIDTAANTKYVYCRFDYAEGIAWTLVMRDITNPETPAPSTLFAQDIGSQTIPILTERDSIDEVTKAVEEDKRYSITTAELGFVLPTGDIDKVLMTCDWAAGSDFPDTLLEHPRVHETAFLRFSTPSGYDYTASNAGCFDIDRIKLFDRYNNAPTPSPTCAKISIASTQAALKLNPSLTEPTPPPAPAPTCPSACSIIDNTGLDKTDINIDIFGGTLDTNKFENDLLTNYTYPCMKHSLDHSSTTEWWFGEKKDDTKAPTLDFGQCEFEDMLIPEWSSNNITKQLGAKLNIKVTEETPDIRFKITAESQLVTMAQYTSFFRDSNLTFGMTYVLDANSFDPHSRMLREPNTCENRFADQFDDAEQFAPNGAYWQSPSTNNDGGYRLSYNMFLPQVDTTNSPYGYNKMNAGSPASKKDAGLQYPATTKPDIPASSKLTPPTEWDGWFFYIDQESTRIDACKPRFYYYTTVTLPQLLDFCKDDQGDYSFKWFVNHTYVEEEEADPKNVLGKHNVTYIELQGGIHFYAVSPLPMLEFDKFDKYSWITDGMIDKKAKYYDLDDKVDITLQEYPNVTQLMATELAYFPIDYKFRKNLFLTPNETYLGEFYKLYMWNIRWSQDIYRLGKDTLYITFFTSVPNYMNLKVATDGSGLTVAGADKTLDLDWSESFPTGYEQRTLGDADFKFMEDRSDYVEDSHCLMHAMNLCYQKWTLELYMDECPKPTDPTTTPQLDVQKLEAGVQMILDFEAIDNSADTTAKIAELNAYLAASGRAEDKLAISTYLETSRSCDQIDEKITFNTTIEMSRSPNYTSYNDTFEINDVAYVRMNINMTDGWNKILGWKIENIYLCSFKGDFDDKESELNMTVNGENGCLTDLQDNNGPDEDKPDPWKNTESGEDQNWDIKKYNKKEGLIHRTLIYDKNSLIWDPISNKENDTIEEFKFLFPPLISDRKFFLQVHTVLVINEEYSNSTIRDGTSVFEYEATRPPTSTTTHFPTTNPTAPTAAPVTPVPTPASRRRRRLGTNDQSVDNIESNSHARQLASINNYFGNGRIRKHTQIAHFTTSGMYLGSHTHSHSATNDFNFKYNDYDTYENLQKAETGLTIKEPNSHNKQYNGNYNNGKKDDYFYEPIRDDQPFDIIDNNYNNNNNNDVSSPMSRNTKYIIYILLPLLAFILVSLVILIKNKLDQKYQIIGNNDENDKEDEIESENKENTLKFDNSIDITNDPINGITNDELKIFVRDNTL